MSVLDCVQWIRIPGRIVDRLWRVVDARHIDLDDARGRVGPIEHRYRDGIQIVTTTVLWRRIRESVGIPFQSAVLVISVVDKRCCRDREGVLLDIFSELIDPKCQLLVL